MSDPTRPKCCKICGVPGKTMVVFRKGGGHQWALDLDLAEEYPNEWGRPREIRITMRGECARCIDLDGKGEAKWPKI